MPDLNRQVQSPAGLPGAQGSEAAAASPAPQSAAGPPPGCCQQAAAASTAAPVQALQAATATIDGRCTERPTPLGRCSDLPTPPDDKPQAAAALQRGEGTPAACAPSLGGCSLEGEAARTPGEAAATAAAIQEHWRDSADDARLASGGACYTQSQQIPAQPGLSIASADDGASSSDSAAPDCTSSNHSTRCTEVTGAAACDPAGGLSLAATRSVSTEMLSELGTSSSSSEGEGGEDPALRTRFFSSKNWSAADTRIDKLRANVPGYRGAGPGAGCVA
jgi:hypothetical protein